jgi:alkyldihydroxyacetonephosphate synthase
MPECGCQPQSGIVNPGAEKSKEGAVSAYSKRSPRLAAALDTIAKSLGPERVFTDPTVLARYASHPWLRLRRLAQPPVPLGPPLAVVRPRNAGDVSFVLQHASGAGIPVVPYGGGTGLMGGTATAEDSLVLDLGALDRIRAIERENQIARVEAGVLLGKLAEAAKEQGLLFAHDPWSQPIATVGGAIGTNGMGYLAAGYGSMGDQVRGLEVVLPTGAIVTWPGAPKATGPELWRMFIGAEGTLGIVTSATIQLFPWPAERIFAAYHFPTFARGFQAIVQFGQAGVQPAMIDYEEEEEGEPLATPAYLHLAFDGPKAVVAAASRVAGQICRANAGVNRGRRAAERFWAERHQSTEWFLRSAHRLAEGQPAPEPELTFEMRYVDVVVPTDRVLSYCAEVVAIAQRHDVAVHSFGIWTRPELVSYILEGEGPAPGASVGPIDAASDEALLRARQLGGSIEYVHGAGLRLAHLLPTELGSAYDLLRTIKGAVDPYRILNPGKLGL